MEVDPCIKAQKIEHAPNKNWEKQISKTDRFNNKSLII